ncbi:MAG: hypothetical protein ACRDRZ_03465 [Pseudonocardiaceae bacterium]
MLQTHACVTAGCDQCGQACWDDWEYRPHWDSESEALADLPGLDWQVDDGQPPRLLCPTCAAVATCEAAGHDFEGWRRCRCAQRVAGHTPGPGGVCGERVRYCHRCSEPESRPIEQALGVMGGARAGRGIPRATSATAARGERVAAGGERS